MRELAPSAPALLRRFSSGLLPDCVARPHDPDIYAGNALPARVSVLELLVSRCSNNVLHGCQQCRLRRTSLHCNVHGANCAEPPTSQLTPEGLPALQVVTPVLFWVGLQRPFLLEKLWGNSPFIFRKATLSSTITAVTGRARRCSIMSACIKQNMDCMKSRHCPVQLVAGLLSRTGEVTVLALVQELVTATATSSHPGCQQPVLQCLSDGGTVADFIGHAVPSQLRARQVVRLAARSGSCASRLPAKLHDQIFCT